MQKKASSDVITTSLQLKLSNGADAKSCAFEVNQTTTFGGYYRLSLGGRLGWGGPTSTWRKKQALSLAEVTVKDFS